MLGVPTILLARTDAEAADMITSDVDPADAEFLTGERTAEGFYKTARAASTRRSPAAWPTRPTPTSSGARRRPRTSTTRATFADAIHERFPGKLLAYNCSPSFNWRAKLPEDEIRAFQDELATMGYRFQFVTLAGFHALSHSMFDLAHGYRDRGMAAYSELQQREFGSEDRGYTATRHQREVGAGYFDDVAQVIAGGMASTTALTGSTEEAQFTTAG